MSQTDSNQPQNTFISQYIPLKYVPWFFLFLSIIGEVFGTSIMKVSHSWDFPFGSELGLVIMWASLAFSYFNLAKATVSIPIGVAFALWDAFGLILIVTFSLLFLGEELGLVKFLGLACVLFGGLLVHHGTSGSHD